jgi:hypothetical protein
MNCTLYVHRILSCFDKYVPSSRPLYSIHTELNRNNSHRLVCYITYIIHYSTETSLEEHLMSMFDQMKSYTANFVTLYPSKIENDTSIYILVH